MRSINQITLCGNLGRDVELKKHTKQFQNCAFICGYNKENQRRTENAMAQSRLL